MASLIDLIRYDVVFFKYNLQWNIKSNDIMDVLFYTYNQ